MKNWKGAKHLIPSTPKVFPKPVIGKEKKKKKMLWSKNLKKSSYSFYFILRYLLSLQRLSETGLIKGIGSYDLETYPCRIINSQK